MPNTLAAFPQNNRVSSNPTTLINANPAAFVGKVPVPSPAQITAAVTAFLSMLLQETGINLPGLLTSVEGDFQSLIDGLVTGTTGISSVGNDVTSLVSTLLGDAAAVPGDILQLLFGQTSTNTAKITALQNNAGTAMADNFATMGVSGYTNLLGTLAVNNGVIQTASESVAYRNVGPATDQHGAHMVIGANMQGIARLGISCDTAAANWCGLEVYSGFNGDCLRIVTGASPTLTVVQAQVDLITTGITTKLANANTFDIWYQSSTNTFHVLRNGQPVGLDWIDTTNIVSHTSSKRKILVTSNGENNPMTGFSGPGISQIVAYDHA